MLQEKFSLDLSDFRKALQEIVTESKKAGSQVSDAFNNDLKVLIDTKDLEGLSDLAKQEGIDISKALEAGYAGAFDNLGNDLTSQITQQKKALSQLALNGEKGSESYEKIKKELIQATQEAKKLKEVSADIDTEISQAAESSKEFSSNGLGGFFDSVSGGLPDLQNLGSSLPFVGEGLALLANPAGIAVAAIAALSIGVGKLVSEISVLNDIQKQAAQITGLQGEELNRYSARVKTLAEAYGQDFQEVNLAVQTAAANFGISYEEAFSVIETGYLKGADAGGDFLDVIKEYSPQFKEAGKSLEDLTVLQVKSRQLGVFDDKGIDLIKEAGLRFREFTTAQEDALSLAFGSKFAKEIGDGIASGSLTLDEAINRVVSGLDTLDAKSRQTVIADVFGGPGEDAVGLLVKMNELNLSFEDLTKSSNEFETAQEKQYKSSLRLNEALAGIGEGTETAFSGIKVLLTDITASLIENLTPAVQFIIRGFELFGDTFGEIFGAIFDVIGELYDAIYDILNPFTDLNNVLDDNQSTLESVKAGFRAVANFIRGFADGIVSAKEAVLGFKRSITDFLGLTEKASKKAPLKVVEASEVKNTEKTLQQLQDRIDSFRSDNQKGLFEKPEDFTVLYDNITNAIKKNAKESKITQEEADKLSESLSKIKFIDPKEAGKIEKVVSEFDKVKAQFEAFIKQGDTTSDAFKKVRARYAELQKEVNDYNKSLAEQQAIIDKMISGYKIPDVTLTIPNFTKENGKQLEDFAKDLTEESLKALKPVELPVIVEEESEKKLQQALFAIFSGLDTVFTARVQVDNTEAKEAVKEEQEILKQQLKDGLITRENFNAKNEKLVKDLADLQREEVSKSVDFATALQDVALLGLTSLEDAYRKSLDENIKKMVEYAAELNDSGKNIVDNWSKSKEKLGELATDSLALVATAGAQALAQGQNFGKAMIGMALDILDSMIPILTAQIFGVTAASPENILTGSVWGALKFVALTAALKGLVAYAKSQAGFEKGGYTGNVGTKEVAGVVHGQEFVVNAKATKENREVLEYLNSGGRLAVGENGKLVQLQRELINQKLEINSIKNLTKSILQDIALKNTLGVNNNPDEVRTIKVETRSNFKHEFGTAKIKGNDLELLINRSNKMRLRLGA